jgi:hypothetical protein
MGIYFFQKDAIRASRSLHGKFETNTVYKGVGQSAIIQVRQVYMATFLITRIAGDSAHLLSTTLNKKGAITSMLGIR